MLKFCFASVFTVGSCALRSSSATSAQCKMQTAECKIAGLDLDEDGTHEVIDLSDEVKAQMRAAGARVEYAWHRNHDALSLRYQSFELESNTVVAPDTHMLRFKFPDPNAVFLLPACSTLQARLALTPSPSDALERWYTPVTSNGTVGHFEIVLRKLPKGRMSSAMSELKPGARVDFRAQLFKLRYKPNQFENVGMIAGGSGITPMLQVIRAALPLAGSDPFYKCVPGCAAPEKMDPEVLAATQQTQVGDKTKLSLLFCNRSESHIMFKDYFDELAATHTDRFRVAYTVDHVERPAEWKGYQGHVTRQMLAETMPKPDARKNIVLVCGPDGLLQHVTGLMPGALEAMHGGKMGTRRVTGGASNWGVLPVGGLIAEMGHNIETVYRF